MKNPTPGERAFALVQQPCWRDFARSTQVEQIRTAIQAALDAENKAPLVAPVCAAASGPAQPTRRKMQLATVQPTPVSVGDQPAWVHDFQLPRGQPAFLVHVKCTRAQSDALERNGAAFKKHLQDFLGGAVLVLSGDPDVGLEVHEIVDPMEEHI